MKPRPLPKIASNHPKSIVVAKTESLPTKISGSGLSLATT